MGYYGSLQVFQPGGITNGPGTPNFLIDLSLNCYQASWTDLMQGGLDKAQFDLRLPYESTLDLVFGNWVVYSCLGGTLSSNASAGSATLVVNNLANAQIPSVTDIIVGDLILVTNGAQSELYTVAAISGPTSGNWTITLGAVTVAAQAATLATMTAGTAVGATTIPIPASTVGNFSTAAGRNKIVLGGGGGSEVVTLTGIGSSSLTVSATTLAHGIGDAISDGGAGNTSMTLTSANGVAVGSVLTIDTPANLDTKTVTAISGNRVTFTALANSHNPGTQVLFPSQTVTQNAYNIGQTTVTRVQYQGFINNRNRATQFDKQFSLECVGFFSRYGALVGNSDVQQLDGGNIFQQIAESYAGTIQGPIVQAGNMVNGTVPVNISATDTAISEIMTTILRQENGGLLTSQYLAYVDKTRNLYHEPYATCPVYVNHPPVTPSPTVYLTLSDQGGQYGDTISNVQTTDMDGSNLINAAIVTGTAQSAASGGSTQLTSPTSAGATVFPVQSAVGFEPGDVIDIGVSTGGGHEDILTIAANGVQQSPPQLTTTVGATGNHLVGGPVVLDQSANQTPRIILEQGDSITDFGWFEGTLSSEDISNTNQLAVWGGAQLALTAWPALKSVLTLDTTAARITGRDLAKVGPFNDASYLTASVASVQYTSTPLDQNISAQVTLGMMASTAASVMRQIAKEKPRRQKYHLPGIPEGNKNMVVSGFAFTLTGTNTFSIAAGTIEYKGTIYQIPAYTGVAPNGESRWGANATTGLVSTLPKRTWNGRDVYAEAVYQVAAQGGAPSLIAKFAGLSLYRIHTLRGGIVGYWPLFGKQRGNGLGNNPSNTAPPTPTSGTVTATGVADGNGTTCNVRLQIPLTNIPQDDTTDEIRFYVRTTGSTAWTLKHAIKIPGLPQPANTLNVDETLHHMPTGITIDAAVTYKAHNLESSKLLVLSAAQIEPGTIGSGMMAAMPTGLAASGPTVTTLSITRTRLRGGVHKLSLGFTETDFGATPSWYKSTIIKLRLHGDTDAVTERRLPGTIYAYGSGQGVVALAEHWASLGQAHDIGIAYEDMTGAISTTVYPAAWSNSVDPDGDFVLSTADTGGLFDTVLPNRHHYGVRTAISPTLDSFNSAIIAGQSHRLHIESPNGWNGTHNHLYNPTGANGLQGWTLANPTQGSAFTDVYNGGRFRIVTSATANSVPYLYQPVSILGAAEPYTVSGLIFFGGGTATAGAYIQLYDATNSVTVGSPVPITAATSGFVPFAFKGTPASSCVSLWVQLIVYNGTGGGAVTAYFSKIQLEQNDRPSPYVDHKLTTLGTQAFDPNANSLNHPFGPTSGIVEALADGALVGFPIGAWTNGLSVYGSGQGLQVSADIDPGASGATFGIGIARSGQNVATNGVILYVNAGNACQLSSYKAGSGTSLDTVPSSSGFVFSPGTYYRLRVTVDFVYNTIEAYIEYPGVVGGIALAYFPVVMSPVPTWGSAGVQVAIYDSTGTSRVQNLTVRGRDTGSIASVAYQNLFDWSGVWSNLAGFAVAGVNASGYPTFISQSCEIAGNGIVGSGSGAPSGAPSGPGGAWFRTSSGVNTSLYSYSTSGWTAVTVP